MKPDSTFHIVLLPGDGIGIEVSEACVAVVEALQRRMGGFALRFEPRPGGAQLFADTGDAFPDSSMRACEGADAILFGAMGLPHVRYPDGTEIAPQLDIRRELDLYAGVRPIRAIPGVPLPLADPRARDIDFVLVREQTEGWFFGRYHPEAAPAASDDEAYDIGRVTRAGSERLFDFAFRLAERRKRANPAKGRVTCVDKANVFAGMAFMNRIFRERATHFPGIAADHCYIDAMALNLVRKPWEYDVVPTENQFGDILSDLGAGLIGGMGMAPSGDIGDAHALFQPAHGSAPDIAGQGKANPTAMILSAAMMLGWLGERFLHAPCTTAGAMLERAVDGVFAARRVLPYEFGGTDGTAAVARAVIEAIESTPAAAEGRR
ncbi:MAG: isocitrate/isopropylmalate family dehydrogenase [Burkholderiales bacterium]|jgi:3-isopropylmalate dehydrogenase|nr:isocitrate/isopropylmalate family dehydrogenase [Burkholderiales bacterium]